MTAALTGAKSAEDALAAAQAAADAIMRNAGYYCVLGGVFSFMGNVLKAAFTRKRELLADAKAVQYTRDTWGMASALNKIAQNKTARGLNSKYSAQIAHLCIDAPSTHFLFPESLATHPTLASRISAIEPHFDVKSRKNQKQISN